MNLMSVDLPPNYHQVKYLKLIDPDNLKVLNRIALIILVINIFVVIVWSQITSSQNTPPQASNLIVIIMWLLTPGVFVLHEGLHGLAIRVQGYKPRYGVFFAPLTDKWQLPIAFYATADGAYFKRWGFIFIALLPLIVISIVGLIGLSTLPDNIHLPWNIMIALNSTGAAGDIWMSWLVLQYPSSILIRDEADAIRIFDLL